METKEIKGIKKTMDFNLGKDAVLTVEVEHRKVGKVGMNVLLGAGGTESLLYTGTFDITDKIRSPKQ